MDRQAQQRGTTARNEAHQQVLIGQVLDVPDDTSSRFLTHIVGHWVRSLNDLNSLTRYSVVIAGEGDAL